MTKTTQEKIDNLVNSGKLPENVQNTLLNTKGHTFIVNGYNIIVLHEKNSNGGIVKKFETLLPNKQVFASNMLKDFTKKNVERNI